MCIPLTQAVAKGKASASGQNSPNADMSRGMMDMTSHGMDSPSTSRSNRMITPDSELMDYDYHPSMNDIASLHQQQQQQHQQQQQQQRMPFDMYRMSPQSVNGEQQFYLHEPSPSRRTWGQVQPMNAAPMPPQTLPVHSMAYRQPSEDMYSAGPMRRAQWGTPQPVSLTNAESHPLD